MEGAMVFSLLWGCGGSLSLSEKPAFEAAFRSLHSGRFEALEQMGLSPPVLSFNEGNGEARPLKKARRFSHHLPPTGSCFDVFWDIQQRKWNTWASLPMSPDNLRGAVTSPSTLQQILIETPETALLERFLSLIPAQGNYHLLLAGEAGGGKSKCMAQLLQRMAYERQEQHLQHLLSKEVVSKPQGAASSPRRQPAKAEPSDETSGANKNVFSLFALSLTGATTPNAIQKWLESKLEKRHGGALQPSCFPRVVTVLDDVHLPTTEESGAQPAGEFLRQLVEWGGWNQRGTWRFCSVKGLTLSATCRAVPQQQQLNERLARHFFPLMAVPYPAESLNSILHQLLLIRFDKCSDRVVSGLIKVATMTTRVYKQVLQRLPPRPARWMQQWTFRDPWRVVQRLAFLNSVNLQTQQELLTCWLHELRRVFEDRVNTATDLEALLAAIEDVVKETTSLSVADLGLSEQSPLLFTFRESGAGNGGQANLATTVPTNSILGSFVYKRVTLSEAQQLCASGLEQYSLMHPEDPLSLVLFPQAIEQALRCMNTFLLPQGHLLLLGVGGSGRRSSARLAAFLSGFETVEPLRAVYSIAISEWQEELKNTLLATGALGKFQVLLVQAEHLIHDQIAEHISAVLELRELPDVFTADEKVCSFRC